MVYQLSSFLLLSLLTLYDNIYKSFISIVIALLLENRKIKINEIRQNTCIKGREFILIEYYLVNIIILAISLLLGWR